MLLCFSCKENKQTEVDLNLTSNLLQNEIDSIFDKGMYLKKEIRSEFIQKSIDVLLHDKINERFYLKNDSNKFRNENILEYAKDTFRVAETMRICQERDFTTLRMSLSIIYEEEAQRKLIDKYYQKLLSVLDSGEKDALIKNQELWLRSYQSDKQFSNFLLSKEEGTMYSVLVFAKQEYRLQFLFDCLLY